jgi:hypothetical protein
MDNVNWEHQNWWYSTMAQLATLVEHFQQYNLITREVKAIEVANMLYPAAFFTFQLYMFDIEKDIGTMKNLVRRNVEILFTGLRP